jgi:KaiC/GvpD/RAD55 family RecA-like ATPase/CheY-like chemotaxis protein
MLYSRISSGLDFLDASIGGLYSNRCYLLRGPGQSGRTTVGMQFLLGGLENGESTMMISNDRIENVILKSEAMGISLESYLMDNRLILMEYPKEIGENFQYSHIINLLGEVEQYLQHYNCTRLVFDTLIPLLSNQQGTQLVNYIYSLINSLEELKVTTLVTMGEPNSAPAQRITQLLEDAVVGSFVLSDMTTVKGQNRIFSVHKMVDKMKPPTAFKVKIEYGSGLILDYETPAASSISAPATVRSKDILDIPINVALFDTDEESLNHLEEIFHPDSQIMMFESHEEFILQSAVMDFDFAVLSASSLLGNWNTILRKIKDEFPKMPSFIIVDAANKMRANQVARQSGADALFVNPIDPEDLLGALIKTLKRYKTLDSILNKKRAFISSSEMPDDFGDENGNGFGGEDLSEETAHLITPQNFREKLHQQVWRSKQNESTFSLVSLKMVSMRGNPQHEHVQQGLELVKRVAMISQSTLRGMNDYASRYMDKVVILLDDTDKVGARAFEKRVIKELRTELFSQLNLQIGKHLNVLGAKMTFPEDGNDADELMHQVTDVSSNLTKLIN